LPTSHLIAHIGTSIEIGGNNPEYDWDEHSKRSYTNSKNWPIQGSQSCNNGQKWHKADRKIEETCHSTLIRTVWILSKRVEEAWAEGLATPSASRTGISIFPSPGITTYLKDLLALSD